MQQQDVENIPIDIHYNKLLDWLVNRRHCQQQWQAAALIIREKINATLQGMPEVPEVTQLLEGTYINYFHCVRIVELLKDTTLGEKNMFGGYSSQKMKDWNDIVKVYEKDGNFLAETAQMLMRNVNYEIPALKKQITKCQQTQKDCDKKETDYASKASELRRKYAQSCKELGIKGDKIKSELAGLVQDLPKVYDRVAASSQGLGKAVDYYQDFTSFLLERKLEDTDCVAVLKCIQNKGNVTTYEWKHGSAPVCIQEAAVVIDTRDEQDVEDTGKIDFDIETTEGGDIGADIDFDISGITLESGGTDEGKISLCNWLLSGAVSSSSRVPTAPCPHVIRGLGQTTWDIGEYDGGLRTNSLVESSLDLSVEQLGEEIDWGDTGDIQIQSISTKEGVASGEDALTLLDNPSTRNMFLDDLYELEAFLCQRMTELRGRDSVLSSSQFQSAPTSIQLDVNTVEIMVTEVKDMIGQLTSVQIQHLMLIRNSPSYVERVKESLRQTLTLADKMVFYEKNQVVRRHESVEEETEVLPKLAVLVTKTKEMQKQMEKEISKKYKGRPINIMGEINVI